MNKKEVAVLRRRFNGRKSNITRIHGCYVNPKGEILSTFKQSLGLMSEDEAEKALAVLKKTLSGTLGKNLFNIAFSAKQVKESEEHELLMSLRKTQLENKQLVDQLFQKIIKSVSMETNYLILLTCDKYDIPFRSKSGETMSDASDQVFSYILCAVCPVTLSKSELSFHTKEREMRNSPTDWNVKAPETGFLFPAFDDRSTNIYGALHYTRSSSADNKAFLKNIFGTAPYMSAEEQKNTFTTALTEALEDDCTLNVVQSMHAEISELVAQHKESRETDPLEVSKSELEQMLLRCGLSKDQTEEFNDRFDNLFGEHTTLPPTNLLDPKRFEIITPEVKVHISPDRQDLIETRVLGGIKYILIRAEEGVEVNGIPVEIH